MFHPRPCGCKGQRSCLVCERKQGVHQTSSWVSPQEKDQSYVFCPECELAWPGWNTNTWRNHPHHEGESVKFPGVKIVQEFVSEEEEKNLLSAIDEVPWDLSQSGRRKQNYGPKCNFKKRRVRCDNFLGYPEFTKFIQDRFSSVDILKGFQTVEQCSLEYTVERGASIDPHIDDCWIWGERIPTLSLLTDSTLTLRKFTGSLSKYNLGDTHNYPSIISNDGTLKDDEGMKREMSQLNKCVVKQVSQETEGNSVGSDLVDSKQCEVTEPSIIRLPMPQRSLLLLYGSARYDWEHGILRDDILTRRVCITYRELTPTYLNFGPQADIGKDVLKASKFFWNHQVHYGLCT